MSYEDLLSKIYEELPQLRGQLHSPHVVYLRPQGKVYITFQSNVLVEEAAFLKMERILRQVFSQKPLALRVVSPALAEDFLAHIEDYKQVFIDFLKRNYPASISWMDQMDWRCDGERITLTFPDPFSLEFMGRQGVSARLAQAVKDIFQARIDYQVGDENNPGGAWYPDTIEGWKNNSRIVSNGNYVMLVAVEGADSVVESFNALFA